MIHRFDCYACSCEVASHGKRCLPSALLISHGNSCSHIRRQVRTLLHQYSRDGNIQLLKDNIHGVQARVHGDPFQLLPPLPVDEADELGQTPLMSALRPHPSLIAPNNSTTPRLACRYGRDTAASLLISSGARVDLRDMQVP